MGVVALGAKVNTSAMLAKIEDTTVERTFKQCQASCSIVVANIWGEIWPKHKFLPDSWTLWSTDTKTVCGRLVVVAAPYMPKEWGMLTF